MRPQYVSNILVGLGLLNLLLALLLPTVIQSHRGLTGTEWLNRRQELIDIGALIENPDVLGVPVRPNEDVWLYSELMWPSNTRAGTSMFVLIIAIAAHGVVLLCIAALAKRGGRSGKCPECGEAVKA